MYNHISISWLNDFIFCPYSIYLHNVYMSTDESLYHASPQTRGRAAHNTIDNNTFADRKSITSLSVISNKKLRSSFAKMLCANGAIRLQYSVYEVNNTKRVLDNIVIKVESQFKRYFTGSDSVLIFNAHDENIIKLGNAIHRDSELLIL